LRQERQRVLLVSTTSYIIQSYADLKKIHTFHERFQSVSALFFVSQHKIFLIEKMKKLIFFFINRSFCAKIEIEVMYIYS
jgi:hypothetical protein